VEWSNADLRRHQPDQTPGERFLECFAVEVLLLGRVQGHHLVRMVDGPGAVAATVRDLPTEGVLQGAAFERRINADLGNSTDHRPKTT
jgi:hypothetical protein